MYDNSFEKDPSLIETQGEREVPQGEDFKQSFSEGVPEFAGEQFGVAREENQFYGEATNDEESKNEYNEGLANAASIINHGLDAVAREKGVESVVQGIKTFDSEGSDNPLRDLFKHLGVNSVDEFEDVREEAIASREIRNKFRDEFNMPKTQDKSRKGAIKAIADMKELISEVEGADSRYEELRSGAKAAGMGYFEFAVKNYGKRGLTELFSELAKQKEPIDTTNSPETEIKTTEYHDEKETKEPENNINEVENEIQPDEEPIIKEDIEEDVEMDEETQPDEELNLEENIKTDKKWLPGLGSNQQPRS